MLLSIRNLAKYWKIQKLATTIQINVNRLVIVVLKYFKFLSKNTDHIFAHFANVGHIWITATNIRLNASRIQIVVLKFFNGLCFTGWKKLAVQSSLFLHPLTVKKAEHLYSALHGIQTTLKRLGMDHTAFNLQRTPCQPLPCKRSPDGASTECG